MDNKGADKLTSDLEHCTDLVFNARTDSRPRSAEVPFTSADKDVSS